MSDSYPKIDDAVSQLAKLKNKEAVVQKAYSIITERFQGKRFHTVWTALRYIGQRPSDLWNKSCYMDCLHQNQLLLALLIGSSHFNKADIKHRWSLYWGFSPHQYLKVRVDNHKYISLDPWSSSYGIKFGDYSRWFHTRI